MKTLKYMAIIALIISGQSAIAAAREGVNFAQIKKDLKTAPISKLQHYKHELKNNQDRLFRDMQLTENTLIEVVGQICARRQKEIGDLQGQLEAHSSAYQDEQAEILKTTDNKKDIDVVPAPTMDRTTMELTAQEAR